MKGSGLANGADTRATERTVRGREYEGLTRDELLDAYRLMLLSRKIDDKEIQLKNQSKSFFQISGAGHEAVLVAAGPQLRPGDRLALPVLPRPRALPHARRHPARDVPRVRRLEGRSRQRRTPDAVALGPSPTEHAVAEQLRRHAVPARGRLRRGRASIYSRVDGDRGARVALRSRRDHLRLDRRGRHERRRVLGIAQHGRDERRLPILYLVEDNGYAISVPVDVQTPAATSRACVDGFPGLRIFRCDGTDYLASYRTLREAVTHVRDRKGPALVHATVTRPYSHSFSDDEKLYKTPGEREAEARRDPLVRMRQLC